MAHTPTPWRISGWDEHGRCQGIEGTKPLFDEPYEESGTFPEIVVTDSGYYPPKPEDARLIVQAVNSHAQLMEVCGEMLEFLRIYIACNQGHAMKGLMVPFGSPAPYELQGKLRDILAEADNG